MAKTGRPTKMEPERVERAIKAMEKTNSLRAAAAAAGIGYTTIRRWKKENQAFRLAIKNATGVWEGRLLRLVMRAARNPRTWQAACWLLERKMPEHYASKMRVDSDKIDNEIQRLLVEARQPAEPIKYDANGIAEPLSFVPEDN